MGALFSSEPTEISRQNRERQSMPTPTGSLNFTNRTSNSNYQLSNSTNFSLGTAHRHTAASPSFPYSNNNIPSFQINYSRNPSNSSVGTARHHTAASKRISSLRTVISKADFKKYQQRLYNTIIRQSINLNYIVYEPEHEYHRVSLEHCSAEYEKICKLFFRGIMEDKSYPIHVINIERVENAYLLGQYEFKKLEYSHKYLQAAERNLFHGTKRVYIDSICRNNFDWRLHGTTKGNIFGKGVSFTPKSAYANHYCDRKGDKVMILAKVIVSRTCAGNENMQIPNYCDRSRLLRYDTSIKEPTKDVLVKYCDDEFYPAYLIHFTGKMYYSNKGFSR